MDAYKDVLIFDAGIMLLYLHIQMVRVYMYSMVVAKTQILTKY